MLAPVLVIPSCGEAGHTFARAAGSRVSGDRGVRGRQPGDATGTPRSSAERQARILLVPPLQLVLERVEHAEHVGTLCRNLPFLARE